MNNENVPKENIKDDGIYINIKLTLEGFSISTNVPNVFVGYGMLEKAKPAIDVHIAKTQRQKPNIIVPKRRSDNESSN